MNRPDPTGYRVDLHSHSLSSDGLFSAADYAAAIIARDVALAAICDHDRIGESAVLAGLLPGRVVIGIELSCACEHGFADLLGLGVIDQDRFGPGWSNEIDRVTYEFSCAAVRRCGLALPEGDWKAVLSSLDAAAPRGREGRRSPLRTIADLVLADPANAARLAGEGVSTTTDFKLAYLSKGQPASSSNDLARSGTLPTVAEGIALLHAAGAMAVLAHPGIMECPDIEVHIADWVWAGLDAIEADHSAHSQTERLRFEALAARLGILASYGSDSHSDLDLYGSPTPLWSPERLAIWRTRFKLASNGQMHRTGVGAPLD